MILADLILIHITEHADKFDGVMGSKELTQNGIAKKLNIHQPQIPKSLDPYVEEGLVEEHKAYVDINKKLLKMYIPTKKGKERVRLLKENSKNKKDRKE